MQQGVKMRELLGRFNLKEFVSKHTILLVLIVLIVGIGFVKPNFFNVNKLTSILIISSVRIVIALGAGGYFDYARCRPVCQTCSRFDSLYCC